MPLVVKLNSRLDEIAAIVMTAKTRAKVAAVCTDAVLGARAGAATSRGATRANAMPQANASSAGTTNAARQPAYLTSKPVVTAASATPRLPARPLMPMVSPGRSAPRTSIGMPTG